MAVNSSVIQLAIFIPLVVVALWRFLHGKTGASLGLNNIPGPPYPSWFKGNFQQVFNPNAWEFHEYLAKKYGSSVRLHGPYGTNTLYTFDSKAMHTVLDQDVFEEDDGFIKGNLLIFGDGLLGTLGMSYRQDSALSLNLTLQRTPSSKTAKNATACLLRGSYEGNGYVPSFFEVSHKLENALKNQLLNGLPITKEEVEQVDILSWMGRTALELMGQAGLGYSFDPLTDEDSAHPYSKVIKELLPTLTRLQFWQFNVLPYVSWIGTPAFRRSIVNRLPWKDLHHLRDMVDYMYRIAQVIYESKKRALEKGDQAIALQIGRGKDLISILMKENMKASEEDRLEDTEVISQVISDFDFLHLLQFTSGLKICSTLIFAAMDTTSSAMARLLHLLAQHPDAQKKLRQELIEAKRQNDGHDFSYEELIALPYLDAVCRETLRLYSPASVVTRRTRQDTVIPLHQPITGLDGTEMHEVAIPKNTSVIVSISNANRNSDLWGEDADEWKPERWLSPLPKALVDARIPGVYSHLMTFIGEGAPACEYHPQGARYMNLTSSFLFSGFKFSQLEMKVVISTLVENFQFYPSVKDLEIFWQMNGVTAPVVGKDIHPQLPIGISLVDRNSVTSFE
ncbi:cytochrome P450 [Lentinula guzmanii]|uniref:Cytochrome P450 n=1 Tax=Lentinula guzmanii TaxID=2804957 RepID=A0AA38J251_9AGAR|nr:cytochrome P450 [Lentinula guzmanii]